MPHETDTELWVLHAADGRAFRCVMRFAPAGVEVEVSDGLVAVARRVFPTGTEAYAWAEDVRDQIADA